MYSIVIEQLTCDKDDIKEGNVRQRRFEFVTRAEKLYEIIGRFTVKYGIPLEYVDDRKNDGTQTVEFFQPESQGPIATGGFREAKIKWKWVDVPDFRSNKQKNIVPITQPKNDYLEKEKEIVKSFINLGILKKR